jgi:hypothetical protein
MSMHLIKSSWSRFIAPRGRVILVGRAAARCAAADAAADVSVQASRRAEGSALERARVAACEDEGGAR